MSKKHIARQSRVFVMLILFSTLLTGCIVQAPVLTDIPLPVITPDPLPEIRTKVLFPTGEPDALGEEIYDADTHYMRYLSFKDMRIYEFGGDTLLDGICVSTYPEPLYGEFQVLFHDKEGTLIAQGVITFDDDEHLIPTGETRIFSTIYTDMSVSGLAMSFVSASSVRPYGESEGE